MSSGGGTRGIRNAAEVPAFMDTEYDGRGGWVALAQFAQHWNRYPEHRDWMGSTPLPKATDLRRGALVAALVHALCVRDGTPCTRVGAGLAPSHSGRHIVRRDRRLSFQ